MKRVSAISAIMFLFLLSACAEGFVDVPQTAATPVQISSVAPSSAPALEQTSVIAVIGAENAEDFLEGVRSAAKADGSDVEILSFSGGLDALSNDSTSDATAAIVFLSGEADSLPKTSLPIYVFASAGQSIPADVPHLTYNAAAVPKLALDSALSYPPHLAPVRMIGLFTSQSSAAYLIWSDAKANGTVFAKQEFLLDTAEVSLTDWLNETLPDYYPGMLDAIYAESGSLAVSAAESLASLGRDDVEVFSAGLDENLTAKLSSILVCGVGVNLADAGARCYSEALKLLSGGAAESGELSPDVFWYTENP